MPPDPQPIAPFVTEFTLSRVRNTPESAWLGHGPFALWLVETMRPRNIVELGTHNGYSFYSFCQAMVDLGLDGAVHAIDTWEGDRHAGHYGSDIFQEVEAVVAEQFAGTGRMHRKTFDEARVAFDAGTVDILHIDGLHTFEAVQHDFETWQETLRTPGVVLLHDTQVRKDDFGVYRLWETLQDQYRSFEFHHSNGLGVLGIGEDFPPGLERFFTLADDPDAAASVRRQFERLGCEPELAYRLHTTMTFADEAAKLHDELDRMQATRSWRITAPLRSGESLLRKFTGRAK